LTIVGKRYLFPTMCMLKTQQNPTRPFFFFFLKTVLKRIFIVVKSVTYNFAVSLTLSISVSRN
jgi:hypothetical protein